MTLLFPAQRAAEEFDSVLAGTASPEVTARVTQREPALLSTVATLHAVPEVTPRAEFVEDLRSRLMLAAETDLVPAPPVVRTARPQGRRARRAGSVAAAVVIIGGSAGMAAAANGSLPGDPLYPIKRGGEQVSEVVRLSDASKGRAMLGQAENRLDEAGDLMGAGADPALVTSTLDAFRTAADSGATTLFESYQRDGNPADITAVRSFAAEQMAALSALASTSDASSARLLDAADTLADIDQEALRLCGSCGPEAAVQAPAALADGAAAASVQNLLARPAHQAQADVAAARLAALLENAQKTADATPQPVVGQQEPGTAAPRTDAPLRSTVSGTGQLLASTSSGGGKAVDDLVTGVTGTTSTGGTRVGESLGSAVEDATDAATDAVGGVTGGLVP